MPDKAAASAMHKLRSQRDRFAALAFAGADMLLEVDGSERIAFAAGATEKLLSLPADSLVGRCLRDMVHQGDAGMLAEALRRLAGGGRVERLQAEFIAGEQPVPVLISAINLHPERGVVHLAINRNRHGSRERLADAPVTIESFVEHTERRLREALRNGEACSLSLFAMAAGDRPASALMDAVRAWSVEGNSAALLDNGVIALVHDADIDRSALEWRLSVVLAASGQPELVPLQFRTMELDVELSSPELIKALAFAVGKGAEPGAFPFGSLSQAWRAAAAETQAKVANFRSLVGGPQLCFAFQPIVCLANWSIHHYEALARLTQGDKFVLPSRFLSFAEDVGIVSEFDIVACRKALAVLRDNAGIPPAAHISVNVSGRSLMNQAFGNELIRLLKENQWQIPRLLIDITGSADIGDLAEANKLIRKLRALGCRICLDDLGTGPAAFRHLRALDLDFVKIDGNAILDAFDTRHGKPFLRALVSLCNELGIRTIGEMIEEEKGVHLLRELQVNFGQGYYFARPSPDATRLPLPPRPFGRIHSQMTVGGL